MRPLSVKLGNVLLARHRRLCLGVKFPPAEIPDDLVEHVVVNCITAAGLIGTTNYRSMGRYLKELAQWSYDRGLPPLNALIIKENIGMAERGFYELPGCKNWHVDVRRCITCKEYPARIET